MNSKQRVLTALNHQEPDRVPVDFHHIMAPGGGYILGPSHNIQTDTSIQNILAMYRAARELGCYPIH